MNKANLSKQQTNQVVAELASQFNDIVIPKINWGASAIPAEGFAVWNDFGIALNNRDCVLLHNTKGLLCDTEVQGTVYALIDLHKDGIQSAEEDYSIKIMYNEVQMYVNVIPSDTQDIQVTITLRNNACNSNLVIGSARINQDTLYKICEEN